MIKKTVLVTGASKGIGKKIALTFANSGYNVIVNSLKNYTQLLETEKKIREYGATANSFLCDVSRYSEVEKMFKEIYQIFPKIDILINNAGISHIGLFTDMREDQWDQVINTNLKSIYNCTQMVLPPMIRDHEGCIINISSIWGIQGASCEVAYSASKGGMNAFTKALAKELAPSSIRVNAIACGVIETEMNDFLDQKEKELLINEIPMNRFGKSEEVAKLALYLASSDSSYLTGQVIPLDGGMI